jgi:hypothetical protein
MATSHQVSQPALGADVATLRDRQAIQDCLVRFTRAIDRRDWDLLQTIFHADGIAHHGDFSGDVGTLTQWLKKAYSNYEFSYHYAVNHYCELHGDHAFAETYALSSLRPKGETVVNLGGARYIDWFERRGGEWRIKIRHIVYDWKVVGQGTEVMGGFPRGRDDKQDLSYLIAAEVRAAGEATPASAGKDDRRK